jgi:predicted esterase
VSTTVDPSIFKAYDIRGIVDRTLTEAAARAIGAAFGAEARARGVAEVAVGRDGRLSGPRLAAALVEGIRASGTAVADIGMAATPMVYFAGFHLGSRSGIAITGSHNPPEYNGMKLTLAGDPVYGEGLQRLRSRIEAGDLAPAAAPAALRAVDDLVGDLIRRGFAAEQIMLLGFSQGACLALEYTARHARRYGGIVGLSGGLIGPDGTPRNYPGLLERTPIFLGCSTTDAHIPQQRVIETAHVLEEMDAEVTMRLYPGMGHTVNDDEIAFVRGMMRAVIDR